MQQQQHNLRQPLNVINLTMANFRLRIEPKLDESDAIYLNRKLERVEGELRRLSKMLDEVETQGQV
jgi:nitrogen fixation/metabolism regulation signal transduction histidine kinase